MRPSIRRQEILHARRLHAEILDCSLPLLRSPLAALPMFHSVPQTPRPADGSGGAMRRRFTLHDPATLQLCVSVSVAEIPAEPAEEHRDRVGVAGGAAGARVCKLAVCLQDAAGSDRHRHNFEFFMVGFGVRAFCLYRMWWMSENVDWFLH